MRVTDKQNMSNQTTTEFGVDFHRLPALKADQSPLTITSELGIQSEEIKLFKEKLKRS
ncbi:hypothetical protein Pryu01_00636 [Paraliobacillus ryukyuensis]|uniref:Uncharacterized protein n=1 Tax=Paraliobacillus ryukyuensis TaxID=200904 RepID=A0A366EG45_9BACI|nr:hypothetical protein [Paraliobacillus ryukyuensis]RBP01298.1 hypothetical protein DES48_10125 [Paraliobacillus ryukyuensis]